MAATTVTTNQKIIGGVILVALAVGVFSLTKNEAATCAVGTAGVLAIVGGVTHGESAAKIVADVAVPLACEAVVNSLIADPADDVTIELQTPTGTTTETVPGSTILDSAPPESTADTSRTLGCIISFGDSEFLYDMCLKGVIDPR